MAYTSLQCYVSPATSAVDLDRQPCVACHSARAVWYAADSGQVCEARSDSARTPPVFASVPQYPSWLAIRTNSVRAGTFFRIHAHTYTPYQKARARAGSQRRHPVACNTPASIDDSAAPTQTIQTRNQKRKCVARCIQYLYGFQQLLATGRRHLTHLLCACGTASDKIT